MRWQELLEGDEIDGVDAVGADFSGVDERGLTVIDSRFCRAVFAGSRLLNCRFVDVSFEAANAPDLDLSDSSLQNVGFTGSRLGGISAPGGFWTRVRFTDCRISYLNLRSSRLTEVSFENCAIDELDLVGARLKGVRFPGSTLDKLTLRGAHCVGFDLREAEVRALEANAEGLRGLLVNPVQVTELAPALADILGIGVSWPQPADND